MTATTAVESEVPMVSPCDYRDNGRGEWMHAPWCTCPAQRKALARVIPLRSAVAQ